MELDNKGRDLGHGDLDQELESQDMGLRGQNIGHFCHDLGFEGQYLGL